jgi:hypothetical protein
MRLGWSMLAPLLALTVGCVDSGRRDDRLLAEIQQLRLEAAEERARVAALEARLAAFDRERAQAQREREMERKLDRLVDLNERLLDREPPPAPSPLQARPEGPAPAEAADASFSALAENRRLNEILARLRGETNVDESAMSLERRRALKLLLRQDRALDPLNPWAAP